MQQDNREGTVDDQQQYVIMFNDSPEEVCPVGTTREQADARAAKIKADYLEANKWSGMNPIMLHVRATNVRITQEF